MLAHLQDTIRQKLGMRINYAEKLPQVVSDIALYANSRNDYAKGLPQDKYDMNNTLLLFATRRQKLSTILFITKSHETKSSPQR